jgi:hypothetical protein
MGGANLAAGRWEPRTMQPWAGGAPKNFSIYWEPRALLQPNPGPMFPNPPWLLRLEPHSEGLR